MALPPLPNIPAAIRVTDSPFSFVPPGLTLGKATSLRDRLIDPVTRDYVRTASGEWADLPDSRTIMLIALSIELGASPFHPQHGTTIRAALRRGDLVSADLALTETLRVGADLQAEGIISDMTAELRGPDGEPLVDGTGRAVVLTQWRDLNSGIDSTLNFAPR